MLLNGISALERDNISIFTVMPSVNKLYLRGNKDKSFMTYVTINLFAVPALKSSPRYLSRGYVTKQIIFNCIL